MSQCARIAVVLLYLIDGRAVVYNKTTISYTDNGANLLYCLLLPDNQSDSVNRGIDLAAENL